MTDEHYEVVVVGSGFGGSVTAYRLAEAGRRVCVLERGRAYPPGSFPRTPHEMRANFWDPDRGLHGLYDLWSFRGLEALVSSGLGGGSLIYANVLLRKDERWFVNEDLGAGGYEDWPVTRADLDPHYDAVEAMIAPQRYPFEHPPYSDTAKTRAFMDAAGQDGGDVSLPPLAVMFANPGRPPVPGEAIQETEPNLHGMPRHTCRLVGECDVGCNWGAKNTLDYNYLSAAQRLGAELRTLTEVRSIAQIEGGGYRVGYRRHPEGETGALTAGRLVLSAGTLGSTLLLLRNRAALPGLSERLGTRFCGNGDLLTFAVRCREAVEPSRGPVITAAARYPDALDGGTGRGFYLEDAGVPQFVPWMLQAADAPGALRRAARVAWQMLRQRLAGEPESHLSAEASSLLDGELGSRVLPLLGMGRDVPDGTMRLTRHGYLDVDWRTRRSGAYFDRVRAESSRIARALGAELVDNPLWYLRRVITVHPLGGCPMGRTPSEGVVDPHGEVFGCPGLHIADGSVMPGPVGANPSLTIAALADRFAEAMIEGRAGDVAAAPRPAPARSPEAAPPVGVSFTEEMKGFVGFGEQEFEPGFRRGRERGTALMFHLTITTLDLDAFIADRGHQAVAEGWVECEAAGGRLPVKRGLFNLFIEQSGDRRRKRMLYRLHLADHGGRPLTLTGFKVVQDDPGFDLWSDTTTLYTRLLHGHVDPEQDEGAEVAAAGIVRIPAVDFARQLTTFRAHPPARVDALARFGSLFAGELWEVYGPR